MLSAFVWHHSEVNIFVQLLPEYVSLGFEYLVLLLNSAVTVVFYSTVNAPWQMNRIIICSLRG